jgi:hypothetical protein
MRRIYLRILTAAAAVLLGAGAAAGQLGAGAIVAVDEGSGSAGGRAQERSGGKASAAGNAKPETKRRKMPKGAAGKPGAPPQTAAPMMRKADPAAYAGPVLGDKYTFLNFEVVSAAKPIYRLKAKQGGASGLVQVEILIGENGDVLTAKARTGNKLLWDEAEAAALASKFNRPTLDGRPARATGFLVYRFGKADGEDNNEP